ncbi:MAG TPA: P1 family peptidase [Gemmatimonadaceae bacterium]|nr:P1 family peptidase [Gemmatimonadaceae bacterium]
MLRAPRSTLLVPVFLTLLPSGLVSQQRVRARALGIAPGVFAPGTHNAITDVAGVRVGHATVIAGDSVRTGVTAILAHEQNAYFERVPAALHVGNAFGKLVGTTQVRELGELETPILLTCTLCVWKAADAMVEWMLERPEMREVRSLNPVVGETNDGGLNAIRSRPITPAHVRQALDGATSGPVAEGAVGAGAGTNAFGWKGGIGTSSRLLSAALGGYTVGVLVQSNYGGVLQIAGAPVGKELGRYAFQNAPRRDGNDDAGDGSIMIVVATDAPLSPLNLERLAARAIMGLARTGSSASNGSGDYVLAFSTAPSVRRRLTRPGEPPQRSRTIDDLGNDAMSPLFQAVIEATEEAIYNSMFMAETVTSGGRTVEAIPLDRVREILVKYNVIQRTP